MDVVVDAVGLGLTKKQSLHASRAGGVAVWIGLAENEMALSTFDVILSERTVHGTYGARMDDLERAIQLLESGAIRTQSWVEAFPLERGVEAFERMLAGKKNDIKAVVQPNR